MNSSNENDEIWRPIAISTRLSGFEVSNMGNVRELSSKKRIEGKINPHDGHVEYELYSRQFRAEYLMLNVFILASTYTTGESMESVNPVAIDHINGNVSDNRASNLRISLKRPRRIVRKSAWYKSVDQLELDGQTLVRQFVTIKEAAQTVGMSVQLLWQRLNTGSGFCMNGAYLRLGDKAANDKEAWRAVPAAFFEPKDDASVVAVIIEASNYGALRRRQPNGKLCMINENVLNGYRHFVHQNIQYSSHEAVAAAWLDQDGDSSRRECEHKDGSRDNNRVSNLAWK